MLKGFLHEDHEWLDSGPFKEELNGLFSPCGMIFLKEMEGSFRIFASSEVMDWIDSWTVAFV